MVVFVQFKKRENTHRGVLLLVKWACNFTKRYILPWVFFTFFKLYKCYQITQRIINFHNSSRDSKLGFSECKTWAVLPSCSEFTKRLAANHFCLTTPRFAPILPNMQYFPNHWSMQIFFHFWNKPWYSDNSLKITSYSLFGKPGFCNFILSKKTIFSLELYWKYFHLLPWRDLDNNKNSLKNACFN